MHTRKLAIILASGAAMTFTAMTMPAVATNDEVQNESLKSFEVQKKSGLQKLFDDRTPVQEFNDYKDNFSDEVKTLVEDLQSNIEKFNSLNIEDAQNAIELQDKSLGIVNLLTEMLKDGGEFDQAARNIDSYFGQVRRHVAENPDLTESQRSLLLSKMNERINELVQLRAELDSVKGSLNIKSAEIRKSKSFLQTTKLVETTDGVLDEIRNTIETLKGLIGVLDGITNNVPSS